MGLTEFRHPPAGGRCQQARTAGIAGARSTAMRLGTASLLAGALLIAKIELPLADSAQDAPAQSVARLRLVGDGAEEHGTAVLIRHDLHGGETVLYFLTSSRLFRTAQGDARPAARTIEVLLDGQAPLNVDRAGVFMASGGGCVDIAVFRVKTSVPTALVPQRVIYEAPHAGDGFFIPGFDQAGDPAHVAAQIRFRSTLMAIADRDVSSLHGCVGAPALNAAGGVFGVINECQPNRLPTISLLAAARHFIERYQ